MKWREGETNTREEKTKNEKELNGHDRLVRQFLHLVRYRGNESCSLLFLTIPFDLDAAVPANKAQGHNSHRTRNGHNHQVRVVFLVVVDVGAVVVQDVALQHSLFREVIELQALIVVRH